MEYHKTDNLRRYALSSIVLFIIMNLYPLILLLKDMSISPTVYAYSILSIGFFIFSIIFMRAYYYQQLLILELKTNKVKTNSIAAKRLSSLIQEEKELAA